MIFLELTLIACGFLALLWVLFSAVRAAIEGRWAPGIILTLLAFGLLSLAMPGQHNWLVGLDAFGCSDRAEVFMDPVQGRIGGKVRGVDFFNCAIYWRDRHG